MSILGWWLLGVLTGTLLAVNVAIGIEARKKR